MADLTGPAPPDRSPEDMMNNDNKHGQPLSKTEYVLQRLRRELASGEIPPGHQIRQNEIAERYGVSPTPVREALRLLEADGVIQYNPHRGATVTELSPTELNDLYMIRSIIETEVARLAGERATPDQVEAIRQQHEELKAATETADPETLSAMNREFHLALLRLGSPLITHHVVAPLWQGFLPPSRSQWRSEARNQMFVAEHEALVQALEHGDAGAVADAMADHLRSAAKMRAEE